MRRFAGRTLHLRHSGHAQAAGAGRPLPNKCDAALTDLSLSSLARAMHLMQ